MKTIRSNLWFALGALNVLALTATAPAATIAWTNTSGGEFSCPAGIYTFGDTARRNKSKQWSRMKLNPDRPRVDYRQTI